METDSGFERNRDAKTWPKKLQTVNRKMKEYSNRKVKLEEYCELSNIALQAPLEALINLEENLQNENRGDNKNSSNLLTFLRHPNVDLTVPPWKFDREPNESEKKNEQRRVASIVSAGQKVVGVISYQWDFYIRLINSYLHKESGTLAQVQTGKNVDITAKRIEQMMAELKKKKYRFENYVKEIMDNQETEVKEIQEEQIFVKLLRCTLKSQTEKILKARNKSLSIEPAQEEEKIEEKVSEVKIEKEQVEYIEYQDQQNQQYLIDVKGYFERKKKRLQQNEKKQLFLDAIDRCQQNRKFNAAVLRYCMNTG